MNFQKNKYKVSVVALTLLLTFAATLVTCIPVRGFFAVASVGYLYVTPDPIGVNQMWLIEAWVTPRPAYPGRIFTGFNFVFTKPTGATESLTLDSEQTGTTWFNWVPDVVGTWSLLFTWAGDVNHTSCTVTKTMTVQEDFVPGYPDTPVPTDQPLTWPIHPDNRLWTTVAGGWWGSGYNASRTEANPYTVGVRTSHILWRLPPYAGLAGLQGVSPVPTATKGPNLPTYASMSASTPSITTIMAGRAYGMWNGRIHCLNLRTGEELWSVPGSFTAATIPGGAGAFGGGVGPTLIIVSGGRFIKRDAISGAVTLNVSIPSNFPVEPTIEFGGFIFGGGAGTWVDPYFYTLQALANGTRRLIGWDTTSSSTNMFSRIVVNKTYTKQSEPVFLNPVPYDTAVVYGNNKVIADSGTIGWDTVSRFIKVARPSKVGEDNIWCHLTYPIYGCSFSINCTSGKIIWMKSIYDIGERNGIGAGYGMVYVPQAVEGLQRWATYDVMTGNLRFTCDPGTYPFGAFFAYDSGAYMGQIWGTSYDGHIYGWNKTNGRTETSIFIGNAWPGETPYGAGGMGNSTYCVYAGPRLGGGCAYSAVSEWGTPTPYYRGSSMFGGDIATSTRLWRLRGYWMVGQIAEGVLLASNTFDGYLYAVGKGPSKLDVYVASSNVAKGDTVWIKGTVLDQSPALMGAPCLSVSEGGDTTQKEGKQNGGSLSAYEENLWMQQPASMNLVGVPVSVFAISSNGTVIDLGKTTSNGNGDFKLKWTPPSEDDYYITASFTGDDSYYSSYDVTSVTVGKAPQQIVIPEPQPAAEIPDYTPMFAGIIVAVAVAIIIGVVNLLALRKRK